MTTHNIKHLPKQTLFSWFALMVVAVILLQTLFFKFTAAPESVYIFETLGLEPAGRIGSGIVELVAGVLLLVPSLAWAGAALSLATISGAILFHLTKLGVEVQGDGGLLFGMACIVFVLSAAILWIRRDEPARLIEASHKTLVRRGNHPHRPNEPVVPSSNV